MKNIVSNLYADYLRYTDKFRAIPWEVDMLKPVERRVLLSIHETAKTKFTKTAKVIGHTLGNYHPHGDLALKDVIVNMVQNGFAEGQGNWGSDKAIEFISAGAPRYTEVKAMKFLDDGFSEFLDFVPWEDFEYAEEPHYLPFYLPIGLIGSGIIFGISLNTTKIPRFLYGDLLIRLKELITDAPIKTTIKPFIENNDVYGDVATSFEDILTKGEAIFYSIPKYRIISNNIYIYGKAPHGFSKLMTFNEKFEEANGKEFATIIDNSAEFLEIIVCPKKGTITEEFTTKIMNLVMDKIHVKCNVVAASGNVEIKGIDEILLNTFNKWKSVYLLKKQKDLEVLNIRLNELNVISVIRTIIEENPTVKTIASICALNTSIYNNADIEAVCSKHRIKSLIEASLDIPGVQQQIIDTQYEITNIDQFALDRIDKAMN